MGRGQGGTHGGMGQRPCAPPVGVPEAAIKAAPPPCAVVDVPLCLIRQRDKEVAS